MRQMEQVNLGARPVGWIFCLQWVAVSLAGLAVAVGFLLGLSKVIGGPPHKGIMGAVVGGCVGTLQWLVLRRRVSRSGWWVAASIVAWGVGAAMELVGGFFLSIAVLAVLAGVSQWLVLREHVSRSGWWVVANIVAWSVFLGLVGAMSQLANPAVGLGVGFAFVGGITGIALDWLLRVKPSL